MTKTVKNPTRQVHQGLITDNGKPKKYLGVWLQANAKFDVHITAMIRKMNWAAVELLTIISQRAGMPWEVRVVLLQAMSGVRLGMVSKFG